MRGGVSEDACGASERGLCPSRPRWLSRKRSMSAIPQTFLGLSRAQACSGGGHGEDLGLGLSLEPRQVHGRPGSNLPRSALFLARRTGSAGAFAMVSIKETWGNRKRDTCSDPLS